MNTAPLQEVLRELADDQPTQPDRTAQVVRRYQRARVRRGGLAGIAVLGVAAAALTAGNVGLLGRGETLTPGTSSGAMAWDSRYIPRQAELSKYDSDNRVAVNAAWRTWSGTGTGTPETLKPIGVHTGPIDQVVFEAPNTSGDLRLVSVALNGNTGLVLEDIPAPTPESVKALAVFAQLNPDGTVRDLSDPSHRGAAPANTTNSLTMFVPPTTSRAHMRFTAPSATVGEGISTGTFNEGVLAYGVGDNGHGPVAASQVQVTIWDGQTVLFDGGPWLQQL
jgi:hypothetical protein